ncbi:MAG: hypothetical protein GH151_12935, partial [Bacteroidetes bacterium]|nr:hypothetical protein [Bacteroidota bacterium]
MGELVPGQYLPRKIEDCPVDAHSLLALCAPHPLLMNGGTRNSWTDPYGQYLTTLYATPVYELLGVNGIIMPDDKPKIDVGYISGGLAFRYHEGGHTDAPEWPTFFEFAAKHFDVPILAPSTASLILGSNANSSATLTISAIDVAPRTITVTQSEGTPTLRVSAESLNINAVAASTASMWVISNTTWNLESSELWLTASSDSGSGFISGEENPNPTVRKARISVMVKGLSPHV